MSGVPEIRRRERCETCAFRKGTEANTSSLTLVKARLCVESATPFLCHEDSPDEVMCAGYSDMFQSQLADPKFVNRQAWRVDLAGRLLDVIEKVEEANKAGLPMPNTDELIREAIKGSEPIQR